MRNSVKTRVLPYTAFVLKYGLGGTAIFYIILYILLALFRIPYPFGLEWQEGGSLEHVHRILSGQLLYVKPSLKFIPYIYTPFYFYISAFVAKFTGIGFIPLRLVSFISSIGCFLTIFLFVRKETHDAYSGLLATGLFAATFRLSGAWFDIARVDSLFLLFVLIAVYFIRFHPSAWGWFVAGICLSLAFLTKQTALMILIPLACYCVFVNRRRSFALLATTIVLIGGSSVFLDLLHEGWYRYYVFFLPRHHPIARNMIIKFWAADIVAPLTIAVSLGMWYFYQQFLDSREKTFFYGALFIGMVGSPWVSRLHSGGYDNVLMPAHAALCIIFGVALHSLSNSIRTVPKEHLMPMTCFVYIVCLLQFFSLLYNPMNQLPTKQDREAGEQLVEELQQIEGDVWIPRHGYLAVLAGKSGFVQEMALHDVLRSGSDSITETLRHDISSAITSRQFEAILLDHDATGDIQSAYLPQKRLFENSNVFEPVTGIKTRPELLYVPRGTVRSVYDTIQE